MLSEPQKSKLKWRCRRGMLELDLMLEQFLKVYLNQMTDKEFEAFEVFLAHPDPDLYAWLMGYEQPIDKASIDLVALIQSHHFTQSI